MLLGCLLAGEPLTARTLVAAGVIISAVVLITTQRGARSVKGRAEPATGSPPADHDSN
ncbi:MAG: hypothetical protein U1A27_05500 [Phycisphaerae bacterium]